MSKNPGRRTRSNSGRNLNEKWNIGAKHCLYHIDGHFYQRLEKFPGALCSPNGYVSFQTQQEYSTSPYLIIGEKVNVVSELGSIEKFPEFVNMG